jgi:Ca2+-dependent lipid-binding protein
MSHERWRIQVVEAHLKHDTEILFKMDPYVKVDYHKNKWKTAVIKNGGNKPVWKHQRMKCAFPDGIPEEDMVHV